MHKPIILENVSLYFTPKICFEDFSAAVPYGSRIAVIGRNGSGKTLLLKIIAGFVEPSHGEVKRDKNAVIGYVPQTVLEHNDLSGGQRFNKALTQALALNPDILLLDEPTNHLDAGNRRSLMHMLASYEGTLITVSHDREFLNSCVNSFWHIREGKTSVFSGRYDDYIASVAKERASLEKEFSLLEKQKTETHKALMHEQKRAKKSRQHGEKQASQGRWAPIVAGSKKRFAENTAGKNKADIRGRREDILEKMSGLYIPEIILPKFSISAKDVSAASVIIVQSGAAGYEGKPVLENINFSLAGNEKLAFAGGNGSGKTTFLKALISDCSVCRSGSFTVPSISDIGYLDQHYSNLDPDLSVIETLARTVPDKTHAELRIILNDFIFRKNEEINTPVKYLSGGEKARLSLALICVKTPKLLILDEITNNIDLETKEHVISVLKEYPAAILAVSHEADFLEEIGVTRYVDAEKFAVKN